MRQFFKQMTTYIEKQNFLVLKKIKQFFFDIDSRFFVLFFLFSYLVLGFTLLGFNRTPYQAFLTTVTTCSIEVIFARLFKGKFIFPFSALVTSLSLSILLNYSHNYWVLVVPAFYAIATKYFFTINGKHVFNPAQIAVTLSLITSSSLITAAPAYQWNGIESMNIFIGMLGIFFLLPKINRHWLVISFLFFYTLQIFLRAQIMKHHLPFETLFLGTLTSPAFFLFTFFMITDPATSPKSRKWQVIVGFSLAFIDLILHLKQSYYTFFFAGAIVQTTRLFYHHIRSFISNENKFTYLFNSFYLSGYWKKASTIIIIVFAARYFYSNIIRDTSVITNLNLKYEKLSTEVTGIKVKMGDTLKRVDPRIQHLAKWLLSVGDSVATGDVNGDGLPDLFFSFPLKSDNDRGGLYINKGSFSFEKVQLPIEKKLIDIETFGLASNAIFVDYDNDGDQDLFITYAFGSPIMLQNQLAQTGSLSFVENTYEIGLDFYTNSVVANFFDFNNDGLLDVIIGNVWPKNLPDYPENQPRRLNLFHLPPEEYAGDERMYNFMHASWHMANNGGKNELYIQTNDHKFIKLDSDKIGLKETRWTLAIGTADFNNDGYTDLYIANDFGADDLYYNIKGERFQNIKGEMFGDVGRDTYKGMNATIADFDNNGLQDVYISNVHHAYQAEGSLLWMFEFDKNKNIVPVESATKANVLNEDRFGWGAAAGDLNNDGLVDLVQANGMVDDTIDKKWESCPDYWYVNEKIARSSPSYHRFVNKWGDIRGFCIYGNEAHRVYINRHDKIVNKFLDVAEEVGLSEKTNSRGVSLTDLDNDGNLDIVITHMFKEPSFYKNVLSPANNWLSIELISSDKNCNREAIGSKVKIIYGDKVQYREVVSVNGFNAQSDKRLHVGLGKFVGVVQLEVNWCHQYKKSYVINELNRHHQIKL